MKNESIEKLAFIGSWFLVIATFPLSLLFCFRIVSEYERAVILRLGKLRDGGPRGPGIVFILPCIDDITSVDLRTLTCNIPAQEVITKDAVTVTVEAVAYFKVEDPTLSTTMVFDYHVATSLLAASTLRTVLGKYQLAELLSERQTIANSMQNVMLKPTAMWGVIAERVEISDVILPVRLQKAMAKEAEATREARAKVIAAEGEMKAARSLKEASEVMTEFPGALQLRYLQTLDNISVDKNRTILFPLPLDIINPIMQKLGAKNFKL